MVVVYYEVTSKEEGHVNDFWNTTDDSSVTVSEQSDDDEAAKVGSKRERKTQQDRKEIVDVIINILQVLTLREGQRQLESNISRMKTQKPNSQAEMGSESEGS